MLKHLPYMKLIQKLLLILPTVALCQDAFQNAQWLRDPRFQNEPVLAVFDVHKNKSEEATLKNVHTYFRKSFTLSSLPKQAILRFTADDYAKIYLNGDFIIQGPEPAYPFAHPYYDVDITKHLHTGENVLSAHVYYHGLATRAFNSADNRSGFIAQLILTAEDLSEQRIVTDNSWRCFKSITFSSDKVFGYETQFNENMNLNSEPENWKKAGFDDTQWIAPLTGFQDHQFIASITAPLQHTTATPVVFKQTAEDRWFADMGTEVVGHTQIALSGNSGDVITIWHGEELSTPDVVRHDMRCNCDYEDHITLKNGDNHIDFFDYRAFRYIEVIGTTNRPSVQVDVRHYPFEWSASDFHSSNNTLNGIWEISKRGVQMGCQGIMVDCASREKGQYTGDTYMTALSQILLTGDPSLTRKAIIDFQQSQQFDPGMLCVAPGGFWQELAEWSLLWPQLLLYYYETTGDRELVTNMVESGALNNLMDYFAQLEGQDGLLRNVDTHKWVLVDWPSNLRGGYDYEKTKNGINTVINAFYYGTLKSAAELMRVSGSSDSTYSNKASILKASFNNTLTDATTGLYIDGIYEDGTPSPKTTLHASGFPLYFGLVQEANINAVVDLIRRERLNCGIYAAPYFIAGLFENGFSELGYELLTCKDERSWHQMLKEGATTTFEAWGADQKWNTSLCHPAGGTPVWLIIKHIMGLTPAEPGFTSLRVAPNIPAALGSIEASFPTVSGTISARYEKGKGYYLSVPKTIQLLDETPDNLTLSILNGLSAQNLRCEYLENPLGIDVTTPRLSWTLKSDEPRQKQTAYQIIVASTPELLASGEGDLWDSGKVVSDQTLHIAYAGSALASRQRCYWKVRTWDKNDEPSSWSESALWSMGLLDPGDWNNAQWIAFTAPDDSETSPHNGYHCAMSTSADTAKWVSVDLGSTQTIDSIRLYPTRPYDWTPDTPGFLFPVRFTIEAALKSDFSDSTTIVDCTDADVQNPGTNAPSYSFTALAARHIRINVTKLALRDENNYAFTLAEMMIQSNGVNLAKGAAVAALDSVEASGWAKAKLTDGRTLPDSGTTTTSPPATMLRKEFNLDGTVKHATVTVTGLGLYELWINGQRVGDHLLAPEWTCYDKRIMYQTYDVTDLLQTGNNAIAAQLCGGWWTGPLMTMPAVISPQYCLKLCLDSEMNNGSNLSIVSDESWKAIDNGPVRRAEIYYGEIYDATKEQPGWDQPDFDAASWIQAITLTAPAGAENASLVAQPSEPIRVTEELTPIKITEPTPGTYVFDMGQNMVGWCRLHTDAPSGTQISMRFGEALNEDGTVYLTNLRGATQVNTYTWRGGEATLEPHFTYFGFRYVQVTGLTTPPDTETLLGRVFHSSSPETGSISTSSELMNSIIHCVEWVQRGNMHSAPTDCPQRDERLGWMGDILSFSQTGIFNRNMAGFFTKWIPDIRDSQADDGRYPDFAPHVSDPNVKYSSVPGWGDAGIVVPWRMYQNYADTRILEEHYDSAKRWIDFIHSKNPNFLWQNSRGNDYNDWLNGDTLILEGYPRGISEIPKEIFATAFFAHSTETFSKMAAVLGRTEDAVTYSNLFNSIKTAFNAAYVTEDGRINGETQAGYALALNFNLLAPELRTNATSHLLESIAAYKSHPSTGIHATHRMMLELSKNGQHNEACRIINLRTVPSWGYMVDMGATTIWERWDGYVEGRGFQNPGMNSMNHWAFGSVEEWIWRTLAGINPDESQPGFKHFTVKPQPGGGLTWLKGRYESIRGTIVSEWSITDEIIDLKIEIPPNTTATVMIPTSDKSSITEGETSIEYRSGFNFIGMQGDYAVYEVESGSYSVASPLPGNSMKTQTELNLPNPGFEIPSELSESVNNSFYEYNPSGAGWSFVGNGSITNSGITEGNGAWYYKEMEEGNHAAFLRQTGVISQSITLPSPGIYRLTMQTAARVGNFGNYFKWYNGHDFNITLNGEHVALLQTWDAQFRKRSFVLPVIESGDSLTRTLTFTGINSLGGDRASLIDDIGVTRMPYFQNPGFESDAVLANGTWEAGITDAGWNFDTGAEARNQSGIAKSGSDWGNTVPEGSSCAFLQMTATISQTLTFAEDGNYALSFLASARTQQSRYSNHDFNVRFNGMIVGHVRTVDAAYRRYSFRLPHIKAGEPYELVFEGINQGDSTDRASFLDSVMIVKIDDASFDPASFAKTKIDLSSESFLELDYDGLITLNRLTYNGQSYSGLLEANELPFIRGEGTIYIPQSGAVLTIQ